MRKRYRVLIFASLVAALVVPVGYALSVESIPAAGRARYAAVSADSSASVPVAAAVVAAPRTITIVDEGSTSSTVSRTSDAAQLFGIGSLLFGLAAFLRKAI
jgi:archaellum component FlaF (FlaF/FlaG flagellin family)